MFRKLWMWIKGLFNKRIPEYVPSTVSIDMPTPAPKAGKPKAGKVQYKKHPLHSSHQGTFTAERPFARTSKIGPGQHIRHNPHRKIG